MKRFEKLALFAFAALLLATGLALAQLNRSVGLSQDPLGFMTADPTARHLHYPPIGASPALSSCGTAPSIIGNDLAGTLTTGSAATTCTLTFATAFPAAPRCFVVPQGTATFPSYTTSATALTFSVDIASTVYQYLCIGQ